jgi:LysR family transcriptional regulator, hypochlorite-specific transcription factor HypT
MDSISLLDFLALEQTRSFSKAAQLRNVTQPAFSRRIQALEEDMEVGLIDRRQTPIALTAAGERFLVYARTLRETMERAYEDVAAQATSLDNPVHIVMPHSLSVTLFASWYQELRRNIKNLSLRVSHQRSSRCISDLHTGLADLAIILNCEAIPTCYDLSLLKVHKLADDRLRLVRAAHSKESTQQLIAHKEGTYMRSCENELVAKAKLDKLPIFFECPSSQLLKSMALSGFGIACLQESLIEDELRDGYLVPATKPDKSLPCQLLLARRNGPIHTKAEAIWKNVARN